MVFLATFLPFKNVSARKHGLPKSRMLLPMCAWLHCSNLKLPDQEPMFSKRGIEHPMWFSRCILIHLAESASETRDVLYSCHMDCEYFLAALA
jgi:hypothetical protein